MVQVAASRAATACVIGSTSHAAGFGGAGVGEVADASLGVEGVVGIAGGAGCLVDAGGAVVLAAIGVVLAGGAGVGGGAVGAARHAGVGGGEGE